MNRYLKAGVTLALMLSVGACDDFLIGHGLTENPNSPTGSSLTSQFVAVQANMFTRHEGQLARLASIWTQQIMGSNNQQQSWGTRYNVVEGDISGQMNGFYTGAGLVGLRNVQAGAEAEGNVVLQGIAKIWEGYAFGTATSIWGDLPYSEAARIDILEPKLDPQQDIYASIQTRFDEGIALLRGADRSGNCEVADLVYCAATGPRATQIDRWIAAAHTLKARFHLHLVERTGNAAYQAALAAATDGINEAPTTQAQAWHGQAPGDFRAFHGSTISEGNIWAQFLNGRQDLVAGHTLVQILKDRNDPRLGAYFDPNPAGQFAGWTQDEVTIPAGDPSLVDEPVRRQYTFRQPMVTWAENQLILAEAKFVLQGAAAALPHVNAVRTAVGLPALGSVTLVDVMTEKYIVMFQNIEAWNDWKRTCIPALTPRATFTEIPGRVPYGSAERNANPNVPLPSAYPAGTTGSSQQRNWNDPNPCPIP